MGFSEWCGDGRGFYEAHKHDYPPVRLTPGTHYRVKDFTGDENVIAYPAEDKALQTFRTAPSFSWSTPTMNPGQSISDKTGRSKAS